MKKLVVLLTAVAAFAFCSTSQATITNAVWGDDGDGIIQCEDWTWNNSPATLWMYGDHHQIGENTVGHMEGTIQTDSELDPVLTLGGSIVNDTSGAWWGYQIKVAMSVPFTFVSPGPNVNNPPTYNDWFVSSVWGPWHMGTGPYTGMYLGILDFSMGTPIGIGDTMTFEYSINFSGGLMFSFTQEMTPWFTNIPEPSALALAGMGGLMLVLRLRRNRRA
jgi:hypothetical protein